VVVWYDGGGKRAADRKPVAGADNVARFIATITRQGLEQGGTGRLVTANGGVALRGDVGGEPYVLMTFEVSDGQIVAIRNVLNPDKLTRV
jgi:hypothetical protein